MQKRLECLKGEENPADGTDEGLSHFPVPTGSGQLCLEPRSVGGAGLWPEGRACGQAPHTGLLPGLAKNAALPLGSTYMRSKVESKQKVLVYHFGSEACFPSATPILQVLFSSGI